MSSRRTVRQLLVAVLLGVLVGGGLMAVTPAGAEVSQAVATNWKKIWKKNLKPLADKRYYTKAQSDAKYASKAESAASAAAAQAGATSAANSATDTKLGNYYTKAQGDAKYAPYASVIRGVFFSQVSPNTGILNTDVNFGVELAAAPTVHYIPAGGLVPSGCSGTVAAPNAAPGNLCVFESGASNVNGQFVFNPAAVAPGATTYGAEIIGLQTNAANQAWFRGTWALRPAALGSQSARVPATPDKSNPAVAPGTAVR